MLSTTMNSPVGELVLVGDETALRGLHFPNHRLLPADLREARRAVRGARSSSSSSTSPASGACST